MRAAKPPSVPSPTISAKGKKAHMNYYLNGFLAPGNIPKQKLACNLNSFPDTVTVLKNTVYGLSKPFLTQPKPIPPQVSPNPTICCLSTVFGH